MQDLNDIADAGEDGKGSQASSSLFGAVLQGPEVVPMPAVPAGPTGAGKIIASSALPDRPDVGVA